MATGTNQYLTVSKKEIEKSMPPEQIVIQGKSIPFVRGSVAVADCELDPQKPRIQFLVGQRAGQVSANELDELLWDKDAVKALSQSILQNKGVYVTCTAFLHQPKFGKPIS